MPIGISSSERYNEKRRCNAVLMSLQQNVVQGAGLNAVAVEAEDAIDTCFSKSWSPSTAGTPCTELSQRQDWPWARTLVRQTLRREDSETSVLN